MSEYATGEKSGNPILDPVLYFRVTAWALSLVALLGIILTSMEAKPGLQALSWDGLGLQFTWGHNVLHVVLAAACFLFGYASLQTSVVKTFAILFGAVYLILGVAGFFVLNSITDPVFALTPTLNVVHILLGGWALASGLLAKV